MNGDAQQVGDNLVGDVLEHVAKRLRTHDRLNQPVVQAAQAINRDVLIGLVQFCRVLLEAVEIHRTRPLLVIRQSGAFSRLLAGQLRAGLCSIGNLPRRNRRLKTRSFFLLLQFENAPLDIAPFAKVRCGIAFRVECVEFKAVAFLARLKFARGQFLLDPLVGQFLLRRCDLLANGNGLVEFSALEFVGCLQPVDFSCRVEVDPALFGFGAGLNVAGEVRLRHRQVDGEALQLAGIAFDCSHSSAAADSFKTALDAAANEAFTAIASEVARLRQGTPLSATPIWPDFTSVQ